VGHEAQKAQEAFCDFCASSWQILSAFGEGDGFGDVFVVFDVDVCEKFGEGSAPADRAFKNNSRHKTAQKSTNDLLSFCAFLWLCFPSSARR
jgi:hypothetical protein